MWDVDDEVESWLEPAVLEPVLPLALEPLPVEPLEPFDGRWLRHVLKSSENFL